MVEQSTAGNPETNKTVLILGKDPVDQTDEIVVCPIGMRITTPYPIEPLTLVDTTLQDTSSPDGRTIHCRGVVADCQMQSEKCYRVCVLFTETDPDKRQALTAISRAHHTLCSYCANF